jgi:hypothetical protein
MDFDHNKPSQGFVLCVDVSPALYHRDDVIPMFLSLGGFSYLFGDDASTLLRREEHSASATLAHCGATLGSFSG